MSRTVGGKFNSIGNAVVQKENTVLVARLCAEVGVDGYASLTNPSDRTFIDDVRFKLAQHGNVMFGWRQVEKMVEIHKRVMMNRASVAAAKSRGAGVA